MIQTYALHSISSEQNLSFSAVDYSRFKYGDEAIAEKFGANLAAGFIKKHSQYLLQAKELVVISSPYSFIPTATFAMKNYFVFALNRWLAENNLPVVCETKVHRNITYKEDYGALDATERYRLIGKDIFQIDAVFLANKTALFIDDIKITGSHERMITKMLDAYTVTSDSFLLYFAELVNKNIHPNIENKLNYAAVKTIHDLNKILLQGRFLFNTRVVKFLLNSEPQTFQLFMHDKPKRFKNELYDLAIGNKYHTMPVYAQNLNYLKALITVTEVVLLK